MPLSHSLLNVAGSPDLFGGLSFLHGSALFTVVLPLAEFFAFGVGSRLLHKPFFGIFGSGEYPQEIPRINAREL